MKSWKHFVLVVVVVLAILSLLLSACGPIENRNGSPNNGKDKGGDKNKNKEVGSDPDMDNGADKVLICHRTGSAKKPYVQISVAADALKDGHASHAGDLIPAPAGGCPKTAPVQYP